MSSLTETAASAALTRPPKRISYAYMRTPYALARPWSVAPLLRAGDRLRRVLPAAVPDLRPGAVARPGRRRRSRLLPDAGRPRDLRVDRASSPRCLQVWPWLRTRYPDVHRRTGRVYVFAGVLPGRRDRPDHRRADAVRAGAPREQRAARHRLADRDNHRLPRRPAVPARRSPPLDDPKRGADAVDHHQPGVGGRLGDHAVAAAGRRRSAATKR